MITLLYDQTLFYSFVSDQDYILIRFMASFRVEKKYINFSRYWFFRRYKITLNWNNKASLFTGYRCQEISLCKVTQKSKTASIISSLGWFVLGLECYPKPSLSLMFLLCTPIISYASVTTPVKLYIIGLYFLLDFK